MTSINQSNNENPELKKEELSEKFKTLSKYKYNIFTDEDIPYGVEINKYILSLIDKYANDRDGLLADIIKEISNIKVKDQILSYKGTTFTLSNMNFGVSNYSHDKVQIYLQPPNIIQIILVL